MRPDLTGADYDALFAAMKDDMPRIWREIFPTMLAHFEHTSALAITMTDAELVVRSATPSEMAVYPVSR